MPAAGDFFKEKYCNFDNFFSIKSIVSLPQADYFGNVVILRRNLLLKGPFVPGEGNFLLRGNKAQGRGLPEPSAQGEEGLDSKARGEGTPPQPSPEGTYDCDGSLMVRWSLHTFLSSTFRPHLKSYRKLKLGRMVELVNTLDKFEDRGQGTPLASQGCLSINCCHQLSGHI